MKKLFGVMILAGLPVACGTSLPSTPDATTPETASDAAATSLRKGKFVPATTRCTSDRTIDAIRISVVDAGEGYVRLRAEALVAHTDPLNPCFTPSWSLAPTFGRDEPSLTPGKDPQEATLLAPAGKYGVSASIPGPADGKPVVGYLAVEVQ